MRENEDRRYREKREERKEWSGKLVREGREKDWRERWEKIKESKFNKWYKEVKGKGIPEYLKKSWGKVGGERWQGLGLIMR